MENKEYYIGNKEYYIGNKEYYIGNKEYYIGNKEYSNKTNKYCFLNRATALHVSISVITPWSATPTHNRKELTLSLSPHLYTIHTHGTEITVCLIQTLSCDRLYVTLSTNTLVAGTDRTPLIVLTDIAKPCSS